MTYGNQIWTAHTTSGEESIEHSSSFIGGTITLWSCDFERFTNSPALDRLLSQGTLPGTCGVIITYYRDFNKCQCLNLWMARFIEFGWDAQFLESSKHSS